MKKRSDYFDVDLYRLDWEWARQTGLYRKRSKKLVKARDRLARAKAAFEVTKAEVEMEIRKKPERYGMKKVTDAAVKARVLVHGEYQEAQELVFKAEMVVNDLEGQLRALEHKKTSLEKLTELQGRDYFAEPRAKGSGRKVREAKDREVWRISDDE